MPYQTGIATDANNLLDKIVAWLQTIGWTVESSAVGIAHVSKNGMFVNLRTTIGAVNPWAHSLLSGNPASTVIGLHLYVGSGYISGANWNAQPGGAIGNGASYNVGVSARLHQGAINSYGFYSDATDNICIVFEGHPGIFSSIGWGRLNKVGIWTGGEYFYGPIPGNAFASVDASEAGLGANAYCPAAYGGRNSNSLFFVKADVDSFVGKWLSSGTSTTAAQGYTGKNAASSVPGATATPTDIASYVGLINRATIDATLSTALFPVMLWVPRESGGYSLLGDLPEIYCTNACNPPLNIPIGSVIQYGADDYTLYPNFAVKRV